VANIDKREIPAFRMGSDWRFNIESIDRWVFAADESSSRSG
jgi:hypothetical protein